MIKAEKITWGDLIIVISNCGNNNNFVARIEQYPNIRVKGENKEKTIKSIKELFIYMMNNKLITQKTK